VRLQWNGILDLIQVPTRLLIKVCCMTVVAMGLMPIGWPAL
jgi:hypothetical protein